MRVLYHIPYPNSIDAGRWVYDGWRDAFKDLGHQVLELTAKHDFSRRLEEGRADILITSINMADFRPYTHSLRIFRSRGGRSLLWVDWPPRGRAVHNVELVKMPDVFDVCFGEREPESMVDFERCLGRRYHLIPNAANRFLHFPTKPVQKFAYDVVFLGARLPRKMEWFHRILRPLTERYRVGVFGPGWSARDKALRVVQSAGRRAHRHSLVDWVARRRVTVRPEEENALYSSARIALNFHEREADGSQPHNIVNQRAFKIAACGGFELCDDVPALRRYFDPSEVVMARSNGEWFELVDHYLGHDGEREAIRQAAAQRAAKDHTYHNRVRQLEEILSAL